jgi:hypothetical protein
MSWPTVVNHLIDDVFTWPVFILLLIWIPLKAFGRGVAQGFIESIREKK